MCTIHVDDVKEETRFKKEQRKKLSASENWKRKKEIEKKPLTSILQPNKQITKKTLDGTNPLASKDSAQMSKS